MKVIAINASPRKNANTATMLTHALEGAASEGVQTKLIHLYDIDFKGCISCFACKQKDSKSYLRCAVNDGLQSVLREIEEADALLLGSPIYYSCVTGEMRSFLERLIFQCLIYDANYTNDFVKKMPTAFIFTMNMRDEYLDMAGYNVYFENMRAAMARTFGSCETLLSTDTYQFDDYAKYETSAFDAQDKAERHKTVFPQDCEKAFELGARLIRQA